MPIQYSGGTLIERTGMMVTRPDLCNFLTQALSDAGWTTISGTPGSGSDVVLETAAANQGQKIRFRFFDPGGVNNCIQIYQRHVSGSPTSQPGYCMPTTGSGSLWRVIANKFQFMTFMSGAVNRGNGRLIAYGGTIYVPSFFTLSAGDSVGYMHCTGSGDTDSSARSSWRTTLRQSDGQSMGRFSCFYQSNLLDTAAVSSGTGAMGLLNWQGGPHSGEGGYRWHDDSPLIYEPLLTWPLSLTTDEGKIRGQLYDAIIVNGRNAGEVTLTYDGHTWRGITDACSTNIGAVATLFMAVT